MEKGTWEAQWIWAADSVSPRNEWRCFRKSFKVGLDEQQPLRVKLTADSRYVLYVNGVRVGRGPVRSWPFELSYDEYEISPYVKPGQMNTLAVLVTHFGIPTFQYLRGRGGLLVQLEHAQGVVLGSDYTWKTAIHEGYHREASRISCQLPFTEQVDARAWSDTWLDASFDDQAWDNAEIIGPVGMAPWTSLVPRDIPPLTEEPIQPVRVESLKETNSRAWGMVLDLRNHFVPESEYHANPVEFRAYLATVIRSEAAGSAVIGFPDKGRLSGPLSINGTWYDTTQYRSKADQLYMDVELQAGDNLFLMDLRGVTHGHGFHMGVDASFAFEVVSPLSEQTTDTSPFIGIGPFASREFIDHQPQAALPQVHEDYERARTIASAADLASYAQWIKPLRPAHAAPYDVFGECVWTVRERELPVPYSLQNAVIAHDAPAEIPVFADGDTELVVDFGQEYTGYVEFTLEAEAGTIIDLYGFEYMQDGWRQETDSLDNTLRYVCKEGYQSYASLVRRGFRYLMIVVRGAKRPIRLHRLRVMQSNFAVAEIGRFQCSDPLLNDIWKISRHTTRLCMEDTFVDCPAYEQAYWVGDARNEALVNYYVFGDQSIVRRCLRLVPGSNFQSPLYADQVPSGWSSVIPNWTFFWIIACEEYTAYSGDDAFHAEMWPHVRHTLQHYWQRIDEQGLFANEGWNLLDWAPIDQPHEGIVTHQNMFLVKALECAARLGDEFDPATAADFRGKAEDLRAKINDVLWSSEKMAYVDCIHGDGRISDIYSMQTQVVAKLCAIATGERQNRIEQMIENAPADFVQIGSPFMSFFYHETLIGLGHTQRLLDDIRGSYGQMVDAGATTCWETYPNFNYASNDDRALTRSHCHAWSAGPGYFLGRSVLGVSGADRGWRKVRVAPQLGDLDWARGAVPLPGGGRIDVSWRIDRAQQRFYIRVVAPAEIQLDLQTPDGFEAIVDKVLL